MITIEEEFCHYGNNIMLSTCLIRMWSASRQSGITKYWVFTKQSEISDTVFQKAFGYYANQNTLGQRHIHNKKFQDRVTMSVYPMI